MLYLETSISSTEVQAPYSNRQWFDDNVQVSDLDKFIQELALGSITFIVDRSHFPMKSLLISATWKVKSRTLSVKAAFVSVVSESYRYSYASELCGALLIYEAIDYILLSSSYTLPLCHILIDSNCSAVIDELRFVSSIILFAKHLSSIL